MSLEADIRRWFRVFPQNQKQVFNDVENFKFLYGLGLDDINFYSMFLTIANERFSENVITKREYDIAYKQLPTYLFYKLLSSGVYQNDELYSQIIRNFQLVIPEKLQKYKNCCLDFPVDKLDLVGCQAMLTSCAHVPHMKLVNVDYSDKNRKALVDSLLRYGMIDRIDLLTFKHDGLIETANLMLKNGEFDVKIYEQLNLFLSKKQTLTIK